MLGIDAQVLEDMLYYGPIRLVGFSNTPTLYRMILPERGDVYVKCGADILINGLKTDLSAEAQCPSCGNITRFHIDNRQIEDLAPKDPMLHVIEIEEGPGKKDCLTNWLSTYTGKPGLVTSLPGYMDSLNKRLPTKVSPA